MLLNLEVIKLAVCCLLGDFFYQGMSLCMSVYMHVCMYVCMYARMKLKIYEELVSYQ